MMSIINHFSKYNFWYFLALLLVIIIVAYYWTSFSVPPTEVTEARGYCEIEEPYIEPAFYPNFISQEEQQYIIKKATPEFEESTIVSGSDDSIRKSKTAWISREDKVVKQIIQRVCSKCNIPFNHSEKMQIVKYEPDGYYNEHWDAACDDRPECIEFEKNGGQRKVTMLIYLNDDFEGGETNFPKLEKKFKPQKYGGLLFYSLQSNKKHKCHPKAKHAGLPVKKGEKYICNVWLREKPYQE